MTTNMKRLAFLHRKMREMNPAEAMLRGTELIENNQEIVGYMENVSTKAQDLILEKVNEEEFVQALSCMCATLCSEFLMEGKVSSYKFLTSGEMDLFVHTILMSVIGMLVDEEIL